MNKSAFIGQLRSTAAELQPLTQSTTPGSMTWNGSEYVKYLGEAKTPDLYALAWWSMLTAIAELIDAQESPLSDKQIAYLDRLLFGGMGSLNDLSFDPKALGEIANTINARLETQRRTLYATFKQTATNSTTSQAPPRL